jgi:hypothetical protein
MIQLIQLVTSGGQTGADQAGWRAAKACGLKTGGWMPLRFMTEDGPRPEFAELYGAREFKSDAYPPRTAANLRGSDVTLVFDGGSTPSKGTQLVTRLVAEMKQRREIHPHLVVVKMTRRGPIWHPASDEHSALELARLLFKIDPRAVNCAGNRESKSPGIGQSVEMLMGDVFRHLKEMR